MGNIPPTFPFLVGSPDPDQAEERPGGADTFPGPPNLPLVTGPAVRFWPLYDNTTRTIRMWKSVDRGHSWVQLDSAHAPVVPANGTGPPAVKVWQYYNAVWDGANTIYVVGWHPTFFVALFPFNITLSTWGAPIVSTLTYLDQTTARVSGFGGMAACFRPSDGAVWMAFQAGGQDATDIETLWGAKCIPGGAGWDAGLTRLGGTYRDGLFHTSGSLALDPATNKIHAVYQRSIFGFNATISVTVVAHVITDSHVVTAGAGYPFPQIVQGANIYNTTGDNITGGVVSSLGGALAVGQPNGNPDGTTISAVPSINGNGSLVHRVINPDNSLTAEETIFNLNKNDISDALSNLKIGGGQMAFTFKDGAGTFASGALRRVARAVIGDAPGWEVSTPAAANNVGNLTGVLPGLMDIVRDTVDYLVFGYEDNSGNETFQYATSAGIGSGWSAGVFIGFAQNGGPIAYDSDVFAAVKGSLALGMFAGPDFGAGWWEFGPAPPPGSPVTLTFKGKKQYGT